MTDKEKEVVRELNHPLYSVEFLDEWKDRKDNVFVNAPAALQTMGAKGFYEAVKLMVEHSKVEIKSVVLNLFDNPKNEQDVVEVGDYVYAKEAAEEYGFVKNSLYKILDTNGFDTIRVSNAEGKMLDMSVEYFSSRSTLN